MLTSGRSSNRVGIGVFLVYLLMETCSPSTFIFTFISHLGNKLILPLTCSLCIYFLFYFSLREQAMPLTGLFPNFIFPSVI